MDENKLMLFERKIVRRILGPKRNDEDDYEISSNRKRITLFNNSNIVATLESQILRWARPYVEQKDNLLIRVVTKWRLNECQL